MRSRFDSASQRGIALVITIIMVAVITFMAIAFLVLTRREKGSVTTGTDQTIAKLAADTAIERAKADLIAPILAFTNTFAYDLRVSTNYINPHGYDNSQPHEQLLPAARYYETNVSYSYLNGSPLSGNDLLQNLANLFYDPRPPVFITNRQTGVVDFRYYLDLNRNGRYDTNGFLPAIAPTGNFYDINGITPPRSGVAIASNWFVGDPEWIGMLERPDQPHSSSNRFTSRFAWLAVPAGKTLDLNAIHNQAKMRTGAGAQNEDGFLRNMGVGPWELNLAGFLADLNTNIWNTSDSFQQARYSSTPYVYITNSYPRPPVASRGSAFEDAVGLTRYRYANDWTKLRSVNALFGSALGGNAFGVDGVDDYSDGPLMTSTTVVTNDNDGARASFGWSGAQTFNQFFTPQDFFDTSKTVPAGSPAATRPRFTERLLTAGTNTASYDRYTFYRLLSQLGTDSDPEPADKMNLNWDNLVWRNAQGIASATNFHPWRALDFFTNAVDRLLQASTREWINRDGAGFFRTFGRTAAFGITNIPVMAGSNFVYTASIHRLLQLAANICDATITNRLNSADPRYTVPSVFKPVLRRDGTNVFITDFVEVSGDSTPWISQPLDLRETTDWNSVPPMGTSVIPSSSANVPNAYGVPWILGARKGLPNFNEFAFQSIFQITRKLQVTRPSLNAPISAYQTNQMYILGISNVLATEFWNSYLSNYTRPVEIYVANRMGFALTNSEGLRVTSPSFVVAGNLTTNVWAGRTFIVPLRTNLNFPAPCIYRQATHSLSTNLSMAFERGRGFPLPQWGSAVTNRLVCIVRDAGTKQLLDYVQLNGLDNLRNLNEEMNSQSSASTGWEALWNTNRMGGSSSDFAPQYGVNAQIRISWGEFNANSVDWANYGFQPAGRTKQQAIDNFRGFFHLAPLFNQEFGDNTNLVQEVPFSPSLKLSRYISWQANDPLVHYTMQDLGYYGATNALIKELVRPGALTHALENIGVVNDRYEPWGYRPSTSAGSTAYDMAVKDPLVRSSDDWDFPTNKFPNIGWLGRIHRGTPWQTVYLKSSPTAAVKWQKWSGDLDDADALRTTPISDRLILDLFTTAYSETTSRGQMSINQAGLAAWSAVFSGVLGVTNAMTDKEIRLLALNPTVTPTYRPRVIDPAGAFLSNSTNTWSPLVFLVNDINLARATNRSGMGVFTNLGDILSAPALSERSPFLNQGSTLQLQQGLSDAAYERLPQQVLGLLKVGEPRFVLYGYGQTLRPAPNSVLASGPFAGMCANYQITAETAVRAVVRVEGAPNNPRLVVESYNVLAPD